MNALRYLMMSSGSAAWANDSATVFYTLRDEKTLRSFKVMRHRIGRPAEEDEVVYEESDETFYTGVYRSRSDRFIYIYSASTLTSEYRFMDAGTPDE